MEERQEQEKQEQGQEDGFVTPDFDAAIPLLEGFRNRYAGRRGFIIGNGPSLKAEDLDQIKDEISIASNNIFLIFNKTEWRPTIYTHVDPVSPKDNYLKETAAVEAELKLCGATPTEKKLYPLDGELLVRVLTNSEGWLVTGKLPPFSDDLTKGIHHGMTVSYMNLQAAAFLGFSEIILIGMDHRYPKHWHIAPDVERKPEKFATLAEVPGRSVPVRGVVKANFCDEYANNYEGSKTWGGYCIDEVTRAYQAARRYFDEHGIRIVNATRGGNLEVFERVNFDKLMNPKAAQAGAGKRKQGKKGIAPQRRR